MAVDRQQLRPCSRRERSHLLGQGRGEEQQLLQRHVFAKRHQMHLAVNAGRRPVRSNDERRVVVPHRRSALDLIAAEQQRDSCLAGQRPQLHRARGVLLEHEGRRGLRPEHELSPFENGPARVSDVILENSGRVARIPFDRLIDVALHQAEPNRIAFSRPRTRGYTSAPPDRRDEHDGEHAGQRHEGTEAPLESCHDSRADRCDQQRNTVNADEAGQLRDRQNTGLAIPEEHPRKAGQHLRSSDFVRNPDDRRGHQTERAEPSNQPRADQPEHRRKQRQIADQRGVYRHGSPARQVAVGGHDVRNPIQRAGEINRSGQPSEQKGGPSTVSA